MRKIVPVIIFMLTLVACDDTRIYETNIELSDKSWASDSILLFDFEINSTDTPVNVLYNVRNTLSYPFQNLYVKYTLQDTLGHILSEELVNQSLFDLKTGKPFGSGIGDVFDHRFEVLEEYSFKEPGTYRITLQHYMRPDTLTEIISVGIRVERDVP